MSAYDRTPPGGQTVNTVDQLSSVFILGIAVAGGLAVLVLTALLGG